MAGTLSSPPKPRHSICKLPVFEPVRARISQVFSSKPDVRGLADIVAIEPAVTAELLAAANSPAYGRASQVFTAAEAIGVLGWNEAERMVQLAFDAQARFRPEIIQPFIRAHWAHSLACALVASELARFFGLQPERAFAFGMLHDIGAWGLMAQSPDAYRQLFAQASRTSIEKLGAEECLMGIDHCKAGSWLVNSWGLPEEFEEAAAMHYGAPVKGCPDVAALVGVACRWADALGFCAGHAEKISVRDAIRNAPARVIPSLTAASVEIGRGSRAKLLEFVREFDGESIGLLAK
jgi:HD-like signal output (HDOD) protein